VTMLDTCNLAVTDGKGKTIWTTNR
jgi:hypothetical protein